MEKRPREEFHKERCLSFIEKLWKADHLAMFHHPVSATEVPGYYDVIKSPIDLSTIRKNIEDGKYTKDADVQDDVALMIANALEFNESGTEYYNLAKQLRKEYIHIAQQSRLTVDADAAFIPVKKARDDESTLRKAEARYGEKLDDVLGDLEKEKEIPLEELRKMYSRKASAAADFKSEESSSDGSEDVESDEEDSGDEDSNSGSYDETDSDDSGDTSESDSLSS